MRVFGGRAEGPKKRFKERIVRKGLRKELGQWLYQGFELIGLNKSSELIGLNKSPEQEAIAGARRVYRLSDPVVPQVCLNGGEPGRGSPEKGWPFLLQV